MIKNINMPNGCRYMSDYPNLLNNILPLHDKFILNLISATLLYKNNLKQ